MVYLPHPRGNFVDHDFLEASFFFFFFLQHVSPLAIEALPSNSPLHMLPIQRHKFVTKPFTMTKPFIRDQFHRWPNSSLVTKPFTRDQKGSPLTWHFTHDQIINLWPNCSPITKLFTSNQTIHPWLNRSIVTKLLLMTKQFTFTRKETIHPWPNWHTPHYISNFVYVKRSPIPSETSNWHVLFIATYGTLLAYFRRLKSVLLRMWNTTTIKFNVRLL